MASQNNSHAHCWDSELGVRISGSSLSLEVSALAKLNKLSYISSSLISHLLSIHWALEVLMRLKWDKLYKITIYPLSSLFKKKKNDVRKISIYLVKNGYCRTLGSSGVTGYLNHYMTVLSRELHGNISSEVRFYLCSEEEINVIHRMDTHMHVPHILFM